MALSDLVILNTPRCLMRKRSSKKIGVGLRVGVREGHRYTVTLQFHRQGSQLDSLFWSNAINTQHSAAMPQAC